jgi:hypothetical protein
MKSIKTLLSGLIIGSIFLSCKGQQEKAITGNSNPVSHHLWDMFVKKYVSVSGQVNYKAIKLNVADLDMYLSLLINHHPAASWSDNERKAYWINAYNAFTIKLIIDNYPVKSIKDIGKASKTPWDINFIDIEGQKYSLGNIEHNILRKEFNDPRIHFAINCASVSCPKLLNEAYIPETLDQQLNKVTEGFVNDSSRNKISIGSAEISSIFNWFSEDFTKKGTVVDFLNQYSKVKINSKTKVNYLVYNWNLNE